MSWAFFSGGVLSVAVDGPVLVDGTLADGVGFDKNVFDALSPEPVTGKLKKFPHFTRCKLVCTATSKASQHTPQHI